MKKNIFIYGFIVTFIPLSYYRISCIAFSCTRPAVSSGAFMLGYACFLKLPSFVMSICEGHALLGNAVGFAVILRRFACSGLLCLPQQALRLLSNH